MKIFFYDTETSGLPEWHKPSNDPCQPHVIQLCAHLIDDSKNTLGVIDTIIKPDGWTIPKEIEELTGISTERAMDEGRPMAQVLTEFVSLWKLSELRVAHNESFDMRMLRIEFKRDPAYGDTFADEWKAGPAFCTQTNSVKLCKLPPTPKMIAAGRRHFKSPNLAEAFKHFIGKDIENAHTAAGDVAACMAVYFAIKGAAQPA